ncbi:hypothetical protein D5R93_05865 [Actinomyces lilanjuaniae]|uniref:Uncharacterized protein n=1 Tax=Actinomyces lilanjuaniae TaxID=2321394 RepID=A0ABN5PMR6_9ACTO|nr:hypothetical protein [Actinomyces lilanjuaniae]AYD89695.1 hypothetical protein D5R93_05865 [Actinomyces lilanjuaniae]
MTTTIMVQPRAFGDGTLPYPWFINASSFLVGRQDWWRGKPYRLVGFTVPDQPYEVLLRPEEWADDVGQAVGMVPVFEHRDADGSGYVTWGQMVIDRVSVEGGGAA